MTVSEYAAELSGCEIQYSAAFGINQETTLAADDHTVHEWLQQEQMPGVTFPDGQIAGLRLTLHAVSRLSRAEYASGL